MPDDWNDVRYYHAVNAMFAILEEVDKGIKRHELAGVLVAGIMEAIKAYEEEMDHVAGESAVQS